jgi:hypothetical protein
MVPVTRANRPNNDTLINPFESQATQLKARSTVMLRNGAYLLHKKRKEAGEITLRIRSIFNLSTLSRRLQE